MKNKRLPLSEELLYIGLNLMLLGLPWMLKVVIKKAIVEANAIAEK